MKRERMLQAVLALVGLIYVALIYPLYTDLWHSKWLLELKNETEPMFLSFYVALGPFLLLAARKPSSLRRISLTLLRNVSAVLRTAERSRLFPISSIGPTKR